MKRVSIEDRVKGGLYGVAVGDALGATVEFMSRDQIRQKYGVLRDIVGGGWLNLRPGEWTDDTEMTLAVAEGIIADPDDPVPYIGQAFIRWRNTNPPDIGNTTRTVLDSAHWTRVLRLAENYSLAMRPTDKADIRARMNTEKLTPDDIQHIYKNLAFRMGVIKDKSTFVKNGWFNAAESVDMVFGHTAGNGALMRTIPVALAYRDVGEIFEQSMEIARMTHWDPKAGLSCALYCLIARNLLVDTRSKHVAIATAKQALIRAQSFMDFEMAWREDPALDFQLPIKVNDLKPTGYTVDSLLCAMWAFTSHESLEEAVVAAVNLGGDADTIGAIAGGLAGIYWGYGAIPDRWLEKFTPEQRARLDRAAEGLLEVRRQ